MIRNTLLAALALVALALVPITLTACNEAQAAPPSGDYTSRELTHYFAKDVVVDGTATFATLKVTAPAAQTIGAAGTVAADACGALKQITSAGVVTTNTTNTFTAPAASNAGCCMTVVNVGANAITLDNNALFASVGAADVVLGATDAAIVCSSGASGKWFQVGASNN